MKRKYSEKIDIPQGLSCEVLNKKIICRKDSLLLERKISPVNITARIKDNSVFIECASGNKKDYKKITSYIAHIKNMFLGLNEPYVYHLEACNVHFPMALKIESNSLFISNFLGEKVPRRAAILPNVKVDIKGQIITLSSPDKEAAGQTAANFEYATKIRYKDRRVFQDGIYIVQKPGEK